jgi:hypothetical protein
MNGIEHKAGRALNARPALLFLEEAYLALKRSDMTFTFSSQA